MFPPQKKGGNFLPSSPCGLVDGRGQQPLSTIRGASGGSTGGDLKLKAWFQPEHHRHHRFYLFYLSYFYLPVMHIILYIYICMFTEFTVSTGCFPHSDHWKSLLLKLENMCKKIESNSMLMGNICKMNNFHANVSCIVTHPKNRKFKPCNGKLNFFIILGVTVQENKSSYHILPSISIAHCKSSVVCEPSKTDER